MTNQITINFSFPAHMYTWSTEIVYLLIYFSPYTFFRPDFGPRQLSPIEKQILTIYDLDNKFIAYSAAFDDIIDVLAEWGSFYVLTRDGKMFMLQEKDTQTKLEVIVLLHCFIPFCIVLHILHIAEWKVVVVYISVTW